MHDAIANVSKLEMKLKTNDQLQSKRSGARLSRNGRASSGFPPPFVPLVLSALETVEQHG